jgi:RimJ/RimL family protein N-acetyltransferase
MIRGEQVNLRAVERTDAPLLHRWLNDPAVMAFWGAPDHTISLAEVQRRVEGHLAEETEAGRPACLIVETLAGEAIGQVILSRYQAAAGSVELALMIGEAGWWGQGYGTDALRATIDACFDAWNLHRIWLRTEASNERAHRLYARCGFVREAVLREAAYVDGEYEDLLVYGLLRGDRGRAGERAAEEGSFVFGLLGNEAQAPDQAPAKRARKPLATSVEQAAAPAPAPVPVAIVEEESPEPPKLPDASEPSPIHIPTDWLKSDE